VSQAPIRSARVRPERGAESDLERLWLDGDPTALAEAHRRYRSRLEAVAYRIVHDRADAEDVVQRIFLALPRVAYRGSASLWSYLYRAALNGSVNVLRARRRRESVCSRAAAQAALPGADPEIAPDARILEGEMLAAVAKALLHVKPQHRRVLVLRVLHGLTNTEIAEHEQLPLATVGTWLRRGREELRRALGPLLRDLGGSPR
jgi:RNA polymerase sigma-70 factor (ECF subfamily)